MIRTRNGRNHGRKNGTVKTTDRNGHGNYHGFSGISVRFLRQTGKVTGRGYFCSDMHLTAARVSLEVANALAFVGGRKRAAPPHAKTCPP